jgi:MHS family proline/betaine transporter-like MFS transporter
MAEATAAKPSVSPKTVRTAVFASAIGNATEWYDYGVFTSGAIATTIGTLFFPHGGDAVLKSLALVAVGFIVRPFGGVFFGPLGDKIGRQRVLAITILLMSGCTFLVGVLPTYSTAGIGAIIGILLLRLIQGFSTGGEYGGAATFISEYAPTKRRGFFGSFLEFGTLSGYVLGNAVVLMVTLSLTSQQLSAWGWRIPFFVALPLGLTGLFVRLRLEDTPEFRRLTIAGQKAEKAPLRETLVNNWRAILNLIGIVALLNIADYLLLTTMPTYFTSTLKISDNTSLAVIIGVELLQMALIAPLGALSDRIGRKPLLLTSAIGFIVLSWPAVKLMQTGSTVLLFLGFAVTAILLVLILAVIGSTFPAMFPTRVRYGAFAIGYNLSTSVFGGTAGVLVTAVINATGSKDIPAYYLMIAGLIGLYPILRMRETAQVPMEQIGTPGVAGRKLVTAD